MAAALSAHPPRRGQGRARGDPQFVAAGHDAPPGAAAVEGSWRAVGGRLPRSVVAQLPAHAVVDLPRGRAPPRTPGRVVGGGAHDRVARVPRPARVAAREADVHRAQRVRRGADAGVARRQRARDAGGVHLHGPVVRHDGGAAAVRGDRSAGRRRPDVRAAGRRAVLRAEPGGRARGPAALPARAAAGGAARRGVTRAGPGGAAGRDRPPAARAARRVGLEPDAREAVRIRGRRAAHHRHRHARRRGRPAAARHAHRHARLDGRGAGRPAGDDRRPPAPRRRAGARRRSLGHCDVLEATGDGTPCRGARWCRADVHGAPGRQRAPAQAGWRWRAKRRTKRSLRPGAATVASASSFDAR